MWYGLQNLQRRRNVMTGQTFRHVWRGNLRPEAGMDEWRECKMRNYTTQMDAARRGIVTPEIQIVAEKEHMETEKLMKLVAEGKVAIPANKIGRAHV